MKSDKDKENKLNNETIASSSVKIISDSTKIPLTERNDLKSMMANVPGPQETVKKSNGRRIRFDPDLTLTPSPKEFKRMGSKRKSMRPAGSRCMSTVVTDKEIALAFQQQQRRHQEVAKSTDKLNSPKPPAGIVQSMCKFYMDNFKTKRPSNLTVARRNSFNLATSDVINVDSADNTMTLFEHSVTPVSDQSSPNSTDSSCGDQVQQRRFNLFRSRSWSLRRKREQRNNNEENHHGVSAALTDVDEAHLTRCSPSYSTKSQDSGFDDDQIASQMLLKKSQSANLREVQNKDACGARSKSASKLECVEKSNVNKDVSSARQRVENSLGNVASLQEGLRLKRQMAEGWDDNDKEISPGTRSFMGVKPKSKSASNLFVRLSPQEEEVRNKASKQFYFGDVITKHKVDSESLENERNKLFESLDLSHLSETETGPGQMISTPLRASFRQRKPLAAARTPIKLDSRIREVKGRSRSNWSPHTMVDIDHFLRYEATLPQSLDTPADCQGQENTQLGLTRLSLLESFAVDGTETQLLVESFNERLAAQRQGAVGYNTSQITSNQQPILDQSTLLSHTITGPDHSGQPEEAIIEMEPKRSNANNSANNSSNTTSSSSGASSGHYPPSPVHEWWRDLHAWCEPECMTYLQSKPIGTHQQRHPVRQGVEEDDQPCTEDVLNSLGDENLMIEIIRKLQRGSRAVEVTFNALESHFAIMNLAQVSKTLQVLMSQIQEFVFEYNLSRGAEPSDETFHATSTGFGWNFPGLKTKENKVIKFEGQQEAKGQFEILLLQQRNVLQIIDRLKLCVHRHQYSPQKYPSELYKIFNDLAKSFRKLVEMTYVKELKVLINELLHPTSDITLRSSLNTMILLGNETTPQVYALLAREGGIRAMARFCHVRQDQSHNDKTAIYPIEVRMLALRALSSVCCVAECIREFEACGGIGIIANLLTSRHATVEDRIEGSGVLAQITSPWIADNHKIKDLDFHVPSIVFALTGLARLNAGEETFLLVTAALANLTFMSTLTASAMQKANCVKTLVRAVKASPFTSLFAKDQVVTVLANLAAHPECRPDIRAVDGVSFLMTMLQSKLTSNQLNQAEVSATERIQKKAAIALSRLCNDTQVCYDVIRLGGIERLVELCKNPSERNYSDSVLVASLAVLRRIKANVCGQNEVMEKDLSQVLDNLNATDLIQPKLIDSFIEHSTNNHSTCSTSSQQESYV